MDANGAALGNDTTSLTGKLTWLSAAAAAAARHNGEAVVIAVMMTGSLRGGISVATFTLIIL